MVNASRQEAFVFILGSNPNGILDVVQLRILTQCCWYGFADLDKEATSTIGLVAFPKGFVTGNGYGVFRGVTI